MSELSQDNCYNKALLSVDEAVSQLLAGADAVADSETIDTSAALYRVLAEDVLSTIDVPGYDNSAMDGYAVRSEDCQHQQTTLKVTQRIPAGASGSPLHIGEAARIFTGAPIPEGADAVVMQECCRADADAGTVEVEGSARNGNNIRRSGEDIRQGSVILKAGSRLRQQELGLIASVGISNIKVYRKLRVACFFTGDELVEPGDPLQAGQIYNSNRYTVKGFLETQDCEVTDYGIIADDFDATLDVIDKAAKAHDLILTSGGVSVGEEDHVRTALEKLGEVNFWRVAMKPGKPVAFGSVDQALFLGLPGNPVSVFVTAQIFAIPVLRRLRGETEVATHTYSVIADFAWPAVKRQEFLRARLEQRDGESVAVIYPKQGSGVLSSASWAHGLVIIPIGDEIHKGDSIRYLPLI